MRFGPSMIHESRLRDRIYLRIAEIASLYGRHRSKNEGGEAAREKLYELWQTLGFAFEPEFDWLLRGLERLGHREAMLPNPKVLVCPSPLDDSCSSRR